QPRVAASATLGLRAERSFNRKAVASSHRRIKTAQPPCGCETTELVTQGSRSGTPGLEVTTALRFVAEAKPLPGFTGSIEGLPTDRVNCLTFGHGAYVIDGRSKSK